MFGGDTYLFTKYIAKADCKAIYPWSLSIVDCFFIYESFSKIAGHVNRISLLRISDQGKQTESVEIKSAYDIYSIDTDADGYEVLLVHQDSGSLCYWDIHERFVLACGRSEFVSQARPYPRDIEEHRYIEAMGHLDGADEAESAALIYTYLVQQA